MDAAGTSSLGEELKSLLEPSAELVDRDADSQVARFYANRSVFITGATGFIGKVIKRDACHRRSWAGAR